jgi:NAD(P)-dependent dehydrogenase (short-subunit alcohol dehydrogenase family)
MSSKAMTIADKTLLVTGANRGLGQSLVEEALRRARLGCTRVHGSSSSTRTSASRPWPWM